VQAEINRFIAKLFLPYNFQENYLILPEIKIYALDNSYSKVNLNSMIAAIFPDKLVGVVADFLGILTNTGHLQIQKQKTTALLE
tara:strand:+ start:211 stop:462 length:252 start_codon:yes stop_codon:yes gene_type:complete